MALTPASFENEGDALVGKSGVERHIGRVDLQHRQQRDVGIGGLVEQQADAVAGANALARSDGARPGWRERRAPRTLRARRR